MTTPDQTLQADEGIRSDIEKAREALESRLQYSSQILVEKHEDRSRNLESLVCPPLLGCLKKNENNYRRCEQV
ncbi:hypothetical protein ANCDUO_02740 [Ancylostoma duodenale]|uniref:Uncharacterized protein n=1 Tax=Ancylostoma duodenale TaxID=51022 RepID=A0A0C2GZM4_9BILA|nr:hypothetical protein ANCDUO_02740 [Ancylostoma duodenale]